jgi:hypothetical protein
VGLLAVPVVFTSLDVGVRAAFAGCALVIATVAQALGFGPIVLGGFPQIDAAAPSSGAAETPGATPQAGRPA